MHKIGGIILNWHIFLGCFTRLVPSSGQWHAGWPSTCTLFPWWWRQTWSPKRYAFICNWHSLLPEKIFIILPSQIFRLLHNINLILCLYNWFYFDKKFKAVSKIPLKIVNVLLLNFKISDGAFTIYSFISLLFFSVSHLHCILSVIWVVCDVPFQKLASPDMLCMSDILQAVENV
jgi:hypothetical protein